MNYYLKAYYQDGEMFESFEGRIDTLYRQVLSELYDPEEFTYCISDDPIDDFNPCSIEDLKCWSE